MTLIKVHFAIDSIRQDVLNLEGETDLTVRNHCVEKSIKPFTVDNKNQKEARKDIKDGIKDIKKEQRKNPITKLNHFRETER